MYSDPLLHHLQVKTYGKFTLTGAIRPALEVPIRPREGYRIDLFRDRKRNLRLPMIAASISAEKLFDVFLALLEPLGSTVHAVLESSHGAGDDRHVDLRRNDIDLPVLMSHFCEFEDVLLDDGCAGVAVMSRRRAIEIQFDEHKLLYVYASELKPYQQILRSFGIKRRARFPLIAEGEHLHHSTAAHEERFQQLCLRVGVGDADPVFSDGNY